MAEYERVICPSCHREIAAYVPAYGDGTGWKLRPHVTKAPTDRAGSFATQCPGSGKMVVRQRLSGVWAFDP